MTPILPRVRSWSEELRSPSRRRWASLASAAALAGPAGLSVFLGATSASAAVMCSFAAPTLTVTLAAGDTATITRIGTTIDVNGLVCVGGTPDVGITDTITVTGDGGTNTVVIDLSGGPFEPGTAPSVANPFGIAEIAGSTPEIEFNIRLEGGTADRLTVIGRPGDDTFLAGQNVDAAGFASTRINLNGDDDHDVTMALVAPVAGSSNTGTENLELRGVGGDDRLSTGAGLGTGGAAVPASINVVLDGGAGDDDLDLTQTAFPVTLRSFDTTRVELVDIESIHIPTCDGADFDDLSGYQTVIFGSPFNDTLNGSAGSDLLVGGDGADTLFGLAADDDLFGCDGADVLNGFTGNDLLGGGDGSDTINGDHGNDHIDGAEGGDTINAAEGNDTVDGGAGNDTINGSDGDDDIEGGDDNDTILGNAGDDDLSGGGGNDTILGGEGTDSLDGGDGNDTMNGDQGNDHLVGGGGNDTLSGDDGHDSLDGGDGGDNLSGGDGDDELDSGFGQDVLSGDKGDDRLDAGPAEDALNGGDGADSLSGGDGPDRINGDDGDDTLFGGEGNDAMSGNNGDDELFGDDGADTMSGDSGFDRLEGGLGNDTLFGGDGDDFLLPGATNDTVSGGEGVDTVSFEEAPPGAPVLVAPPAFVNPSSLGVTVNLFANPGTATGEGSDTLTGIEEVRGSDFNDTFIPSLDDESFHGGAGIDTYSATGVPSTAAKSPVTVDLGAGTATGQGNDALFSIENVIGSPFDDTLTGDADNNVLSGQQGNDAIDGAGGVDAADFTQGPNDSAGHPISPERLVKVDLAAGTATGQGTDTLVNVEDLVGSPWADTLAGNDGPNVINGGAGNDIINAGAGDDTLYGGAGDDTLNGGEGDDTENGEAGADTFNQEDHKNGGDAMSGGAGNDVVDYGARKEAVTVIKDGLANDGERGEKDNVNADIETFVPPVSIVVTTPDGQVMGTGRTFGSLNIPLNGPIVGMAATPSGKGYWLVAGDGGIFSFGDAEFFGSTGAIILNRPIIGMAATGTGKGYWLVADDGGIFAFGDARFFGSTGNIVLNQPIVGMASTPSGAGYWMVATDGGIFSFGDAGFFGSTGSTILNRPIIGMAATPSGKGYWLVADDGGIFNYGDAAFFGSGGATKLAAPVIGITSTPTGAGYYLVLADGAILGYGDAKVLGEAVKLPVNTRFVAMTVMR